MLELFAALTSDYMSSEGMAMASSIPVAGVLALKGLRSRRVQNARDILLGEIRLGKQSIEFHDADEAAAITYRYMRAAEEGAARLNLRLLARVIVGSADGPGLYADDFLRWADVLAGLRREEVIVLGVMQRLGAREPESLLLTSPITKFWQDCWMTLLNEYGIEVSDATTHAASLMRTGLVSPASEDVSSGIAFIGTRQLAELNAVMAIEGVLARADSEAGV